jgi:hypothetical protein
MEHEEFIIENEDLINSILFFRFISSNDQFYNKMLL